MGPSGTYIAGAAAYSGSGAAKGASGFPALDSGSEI